MHSLNIGGLRYNSVDKTEDLRPGHNSGGTALKKQGRGQDIQEFLQQRSAAWNSKR